jgi:hypothetical protein
MNIAVNHLNLQDSDSKKVLHFISDDAARYAERIRRVIARNKGVFPARDYVLLGFPIGTKKMPDPKDRRGFVFPVELAAKSAGFSIKTLYEYRAYAFKYGLFYDVIKELLARNLDFLLIVRLHQLFHVSTVSDLKRLMSVEKTKKVVSYSFGRVLYKRILTASLF